MKLISSIAVAALIASAPSLADEQVPSYARQAGDLMHLDNGMVVEGRDIRSADGYTSGFRLIAGFSPITLPRLDLGAELSYRESDEVPMRQGEESMILNTTSLGGSLVAGVRLGRLGLFAKSGVAGWEGDPASRTDFLTMNTQGTSRIHGFGARMQFDRLVSRIEFEKIDAPSMAHLNLVTASIHYSF